MLANAQSPVDQPSPPDRDLEHACDSSEFLKVATHVEGIRKQHKLSAQQFAQFAREPNTIVLDARGAAAFRHLHVKGSVNLPYTAFSQEALQKLIPSKKTRILIYCRNNLRHIRVGMDQGFGDSRNSDDLELSFTKEPAAGLNIPTFITLYIYGYHDVWELDSVIDPDQSVLQFEAQQ